MDKEIYRHRDYVRGELNRIKRIGNHSARLEAYRALARYHKQETWNFQHERQIHLYVTIIFGILMFAGWGILFAWILATNACFDIVTGLLLALVAILTILEACYIGVLLSDGKPHTDALSSGQGNLSSYSGYAKMSSI